MGSYLLTAVFLCLFRLQETIALLRIECTGLGVKRDTPDNAL